MENQTQIQTKNGQSTNKTNAKPFYQQQVETFTESVKTGKATFLGVPDETGRIILKPNAVKSAITGKVYKGLNQLHAQNELKKNNSNDNSLIDYENAKKLGTYITKGSKSILLVSYNNYEKKNNVYFLFPASSVKNPEKLLDNNKNRFQRYQNENVVFEATEEDAQKPEVYLGKYLAATSVNGVFITTKNIQDQFKNKFENQLENAISNKQHIEIISFGKKASTLCTQMIRSKVGEMEKITSRERKEKNYQINKSNAMSMV